MASTEETLAHRRCVRMEDEGASEFETELAQHEIYLGSEFCGNLAAVNDEEVADFFVGAWLGAVGGGECTGSRR